MILLAAISHLTPLVLSPHLRMASEQNYLPIMLSINIKVSHLYFFPKSHLQVLQNLGVFSLFYFSQFFKNLCVTKKHLWYFLLTPKKTLFSAPLEMGDRQTNL